MPLRSLPHRPSLEHLRNEAREFQHRLGEGDPSALVLAREFHPRFVERAESFRLSDAQLTIARSYGYPSWTKLKTYVEAITAYTRNPGRVQPQDDPAEEFLRLACLTYGGDDLSHPARAAEMLRNNPSLSGHSIYSAAAVCDAPAADRMLRADHSLATTGGGPFGWEPLMYVAYSRLVSDDPRHSHVAVARLLLEHGADPNAGYLWDGTYLFTALTGAFGYGEDSPNQPPHHESIALATLLLEAGADPNDDQTIYNRHFRPDNDYLELLLAHGLGKARRGPWPKRLGDHLAEPKQLLEDVLVFASDKDDYAERVALLLRHDVDPDGRGTQHPALEGMRPIERAHVYGARRNFDLLLAAGARPPAADPIDKLLGLCMQGQQDAVRREISRHPMLAAAAIERHPGLLVDAAERGNIEGVALLAELGYDVNLRRIGQAALHLAAYAGNRELCELLLSLGADPNLEDNAFHAPASGWARHAHHDELASWLEEAESRQSLPPPTDSSHR
jgi:ankyrin repeat protein